jgi:hypothetical protein
MCLKYLETLKVLDLQAFEVFTEGREKKIFVAVNPLGLGLAEDICRSNPLDG